MLILLTYGLRMALRFNVQSYAVPEARGSTFAYVDCEL